MRKLIVAVWSVNTEHMQNTTLDARMTNLTAAIAQAQAEVHRMAGRNGLSLGDSPLGLFVAPEYLFAHPAPGHNHNTPDRRHMEEADKVIQLARLQALSLNHPRIILVPGTIAWRKPLERMGAKLTSTKTGELKAVSREHKSVKALVSYAVDMKLVPNDELAGPRHGVKAATTAEKIGFVRDVAATHMARNTAYVLLGGNVILKYNKRGDFHEVLQPDNSTIHIPGALMGRFDIRTEDPTLRPITFGIEICLDHAFKTAARGLPNFGNVDIHIVTSAALPIVEERLICKPGGYLVHASSRAAYSKIQQRNTGFKSIFETMSTPEPITIARAEGNLLLWEIELDLAIKDPVLALAKFA